MRDLRMNAFIFSYFLYTSSKKGVGSIIIDADSLTKYCHEFSAPTQSFQLSKFTAIVENYVTHSLIYRIWTGFRFLRNRIGSSNLTLFKQSQQILDSDLTNFLLACWLIIKCFVAAKCLNDIRIRKLELASNYYFFCFQCKYWKIRPT